MLRISAFFWVWWVWLWFFLPSLEPYLRDIASIFTQGWRVFFVRPYVHGYAAYACLIDFVDNFTTGWVEISLNSQAVVDSNLKLQTSLDSKLKKIKHIFRSVLFFKIKVGFLLVLYYISINFQKPSGSRMVERWRSLLKVMWSWYDGWHHILRTKWTKIIQEQHGWEHQCKWSVSYMRHIYIYT